jgi:hypothetical protein
LSNQLQQFLDRHLKELNYLVDGDEHNLVFQIKCSDVVSQPDNSDYIKGVRCFKGFDNATLNSGANLLLHLR